VATHVCVVLRFGIHVAVIPVSHISALLGGNLCMTYNVLFISVMFWKSFPSILKSF
jgi:hypothetical protein